MARRICIALRVVLAGFAVLGFALPVQAQDLTPSSKSYPDGHGGEVTFPMGEQSFVDAVERRTVGDPDGGAFSDRPDALVGPPRFADDGADAVYTLGCGGTIEVAFTSNTLIDIPGRDLYIFEVGRDIEAMAVAVSEDGQDWTRIGMVSGGNASLDIGPFTPAGRHYRYVRLIDLEEVCEGRTPGADVDAIGAIGAATRLQVDSAVLFDTDDATLKDEAYEVLDDIITRIPNPRQTQIEVLGHTDNRGSVAYNQRLSERRAETVASYLRRQSAFMDDMVLPRGYGEARPVASNRTPEGRRRNRRVEFNVRTMHATDATTGATQEVLGVWRTTEYGILEIRQRLNAERVVYGTYSGRPRTVRGSFTSPTVFEGVWMQPRSPRTCGTEQGGYQHWGKVRMEFESARRETFTATYSYCDEPPTENAFEGRRMM
jgi:outer membrane protein OmpA-like peptidoglycan-associated protein